MSTPPYLSPAAPRTTSLSPLPPRYWLNRKAVLVAVGGRRALERAEQEGALVRVRGVCGLKQARYERYWVERYLEVLAGVRPLAEHVRAVRTAHKAS